MQRLGGVADQRHARRRLLERAQQFEPIARTPADLENPARTPAEGTLQLLAEFSGVTALQLRRHARGSSAQTTVKCPLGSGSSAIGPACANRS